MSRSGGTGSSRELRLERFTVCLDHFLTHGGRLPTVVKIAGTSGKGSVAAMLEAALIAGGERVGVLTSPHLVAVTERIRIAGRDIGEAELDALERESAALFRAIDEALGPGRPRSFFDTILVLALLAFWRFDVSVAVVEAGIGGASDITSLVPGDLATITTIGLDHLDELGSSLAEIAADKAGIASEGSILVLGPGIAADLRELIGRRARARGVGLVAASRATIAARSLGVRGHEVRAGGVEFRLPLAGDFQLDNLATALAILEQLRKLGRGRADVAGLARTRWPGRLEHWPGRPAWLLDCGHNELALAAVARFLDHEDSLKRPLTLVLGASSERVAAAGLALLGPRVDAIELVGGFHRAVVGESSRQYRMWETPEALVDSLLESRAGTVVVTGSLYLVGRCRQRLLGRGREPAGG